MAIDANVAFVNTNATAFPDTEAINASGPTSTDGTEFVKVMIDNYMFGPQQALLNFAGLVPDGIPEADGASQELEALQKSFGFPGEAVNWYGDLDPAVVGARILLLHGQGVLIATYPELTDSVYVGDGNNGTAPAFYKADDAGGTIRNIAGTFLILPDARDVFPVFKPKPDLSARFDNNGVATTKKSDNDAFIQSVVRTGVGISQITWVAGFFGTDTPSVQATQGDAVGNQVSCSARNASATIVDIFTVAHGGAAADEDFQIEVSRQDTDANPFGDDFIEPGIRF